MARGAPAVSGRRAPVPPWCAGGYPLSGGELHLAAACDDEENGTDGQQQARATGDGARGGTGDREATAVAGGVATLGLLVRDGLGDRAVVVLGGHGDGEARRRADLLGLVLTGGDDGGALLALAGREVQRDRLAVGRVLQADGDRGAVRLQDLPRHVG